MTTDIKFQICHGMVPGTITYTLHVFWESARERQETTYVHTHKTPKTTSATALNC